MEGAKMSKISELAELLVSKNHLPQTDADRFVRIMFDVINSQLHRDRLVKVKGLGTFKLTNVRDRESINVTTGERITIEARDKITFTPDPVLRDLVNKPFSEFETVELNDGVDFSSIPEAEEPEETKEPQEADNPNEPIEPNKPNKPNKPIEPIEPNKHNNPIEPIEPNNPDNPNNPIEPIEPNNPNNPNVPAAPPAQRKTLMEQAFDEEKPLPTRQPRERQADDEGGKPKVDRRHVVVAKASLWLGGLLAVVLFAGIGLLAYSYGRVTAERDQLAQLVARQDQRDKALTHPRGKTLPRKEAAATPPQPAEKDSAALTAPQEPASGKAEANPTPAPTKDKQRQDEPSATHTPAPAEQEKAATPTEADEARYNRDPRVRTGAYRIVGVDRVVTARKGQSLAGISKSQLGPGMECYVEALNGKGPIKEGQKIKIPKLRLKKRK